MKRICLFPVFHLFFIFVVTGCAPAIINVEMKPAPDDIFMFGRFPERTFFANVHISDSLIQTGSFSLYGASGMNSVLATNNIIIASDLSGRVYAYNITSDKSAGYLKYKGAIHATPVISKFRLIIPLVLRQENKSQLIYYDLSLSKEITSVTIKGKIYKELLLFDDGVVVVTEEGTLCKYDFNGKQIYATDLGATVSSSPTVSGTNIMIGLQNGEFVVVNFSGQIINNKKITMCPLNSLSSRNDRIFIGTSDSSVYCLHSQSLDVLWKLKTSGSVLMIPATDDSSVYFGTVSGEFYAVNSCSGSVRWFINSQGAFLSSPLVTNNRILAPNLSGKLHILNKTNGKETGLLTFESRMKLTPVFYRNKIILGIDRGEILLYESR